MHLGSDPSHEVKSGILHLWYPISTQKASGYRAFKIWDAQVTDV